MGKTRCLIVTKKISELAEQVDKSKKLVKELVALWQKENTQPVDAYPSVEALKKMIDKHIKSKEFNIVEETQNQILESFEGEYTKPKSEQDSYIDTDIKLNQEFDVSERKRVVKKLAKLFNNVINSKYKEEIKSIGKLLKEDPNNDKLFNNLESLSKLDIIKKYGLTSLLNELKSLFDDYISYYEKGEEYQKKLIEKERNKKQGMHINITDKQAREYVDNKYNQYKKISKYFLSLFQEASSLIERNDKIKLNFKFIGNKNINEASESEVIYNEDSEDALEKEENYKEGWQIDARQTSQRDSVSIVTRRLLNDIFATSPNGEYLLDNEGDFVYLDSSYAHGALLSAFMKMENSDDLETCLTEFSRTHKWAQQILNKVKKYPQIKSQFYQDFKKAAMSYWIQVTNKDGKVVTIKSNKRSGYYYIIDEWRDNYTSGTIVTENEEDSVYERKNNVILFRTNVADRHLTTLNAIKRKLLNSNSIDSSGRFTEEFKQFINILNSIGINTDPYIIANIFNKETQVYRKRDIINKINVILSGIKKGEMNPKKVKEETIYPDFINVYENAFSTIAESFAICDENTIETMAREGDKSYYTYSNPSYLDKTISLLKGELIRFSEENDEYGINYLKEIENQYGQFKYWFKTKDGKEYLNHWLALLTKQNEDGTLSNEAKKYRKILDHKVLLNRDGIEYKDMLKVQYNAAVIQEFFSVNNTNESVHSAWYYVPILSDAPSAEFIKFVMYDQDNYKEIILNQLMNLVKQEIKRINLVLERKQLLKENPKLKPIANFDTGRGEKFCFIPQLNDLTYEVDGKIISFTDKIQDIINAKGTKGSVDSFIKEELSKILDSEFKEALSKWEELNIYNEKNRPNIDGVTYTEDENKNKELLNKKLELYFYNSYLATSQIIQLTTTDLAFYKSVEDLQKRYKEVHSPTQRIDTKAVFNHKKEDGAIEEIRLGKDLETHIVLKDEFVSFDKEDLKVLNDILSKAVRKKELDESDRIRILKEYENINITDAQAYRTLDSYISILAMSGKLDDKLWNAYNRIKNGKILPTDFNLFLQTLKPFVFTQQLNVNSGIEKHPYLKVPLQHKNSEMVLLSIYSSVASALKKDSNPTKLQALNQFMVDNNIDLINFESAVKVGLQGAIDLSDKVIEQRKKEDNISTYEATLRILKEQTGFKEIGGIDKNKEYNSDIVHQLSYEDYGIASATHEHLLDLTQLEGSQIRKLIIADLPEDTTFDVGDLVLTKQQLIDLYNEAHFYNIQDEYEQLYKDFEDPKKLQQILKDEIKNNDRYSKELLNLLSLNENGEFIIPLYEPIQSSRIQALLSSIVKSRIIKQKIKGGSCVQCSNFGYSDDLKFKFDTFKDKNGETRHRIKYMEVYMPAYSKKFFKPFMDSKTGEIDINKMPEELRNCLGYRVPTEDKYSMLTIRIKGFMPVQNGSAIMLPTGITTMTGSDFDVDKLYIMLPEFKVRKDKDTHKTTFEKVKYNITDLKNSSKAARNNLILDIMTAVLRNEDLAVNQLNPGGFVEQTKASKIYDILAYSNLNELLRELNCKEDKLIYILNSLSVKELKSIQEKLIKEKSPLNPLTQVDLFELTMTGASSIGMYANYNSAHAVLQHTKLELVKPIDFLGTTYKSLHEIKSPNDGSFITRIISGFLAGSVDNVKENLLAGLNQNIFTIPTTMLLANLGVPVRDIALFINQPCIRYVQKLYDNRNSYKTIEDVIKEYKETLKNQLKSLGVSYAKLTFNTEEEKKGYHLINETDLALAIAKSKSFQGDYTKLNGRELANYINLQLQCLRMFDYLLKISGEFRSIASSIKCDTQNGAGGPNISDFYDKIDGIENMNSDGFKYLDGYESIIFKNDLPINDLLNTSYGEFVKNKAIPLQEAFYAYGIYGAGELFKKHFPFGNYVFRQIKNLFEEKATFLTNKDLDKIYNEFFAFILSDTDFFGDKSKSKEVQDFNRSSFINNFPFYFNTLKRNNPELKNYELIRRLKYEGGTKRNPIPTIVFKNVGTLNSELRYNISKEWASLLFSDNPEYVQLAMNLFKYCYYRNGFDFSPNTFIHLAPTVLKLNIPEYIEKLKNIKDLDISEAKIQQFYIQYCLNHPHSYKVVKSYKSKEDEVIKNLLDIINYVDKKTKGSKRLYIGNIFVPSGGEKSEDFDTIFTSEDSNIKIDSKLSNKIMYSLRDSVFNIDGNFYYADLNYTDNNNYEFSIINLKTLGVENNFLEYSYNRDVFDDFETAVDPKKVSFLREETSNKEDNTETSDVTPNVTTKTDVNLGLIKDDNDGSSKSKPINKTNIDGMSLYTENDKLLEETKTSGFMESYYKSDYVERENMIDFNSLKENNNFEDANGQKPC